LAFVDSGVATMLLGQDQGSLGRVTSDMGGVLEGFVAMEIARQLTWAGQTVELSHYRTRDKVEVDIVLQNRRQQVVAIEVKSAATVADADFNGLRHLRARVGSQFLAGLVLHLGPQTLPFGDRLRAMPVSALWHCA
jgi:predicted AAA+ superfamily ATPase